MEKPKNKKKKVLTKNVDSAVREYEIHVVLFQIPQGLGILSKMEVKVILRCS